MTILRESDSGEMLASEVKSVLLRLRPNFSEKSVGFSTFGKLLTRLAQQFGAFTVESERYNLIVTLGQPHAPAGEQITRDNFTHIFARILSEYKEDGFDRVNPSILKSAVQAEYPDFTERQIGLRRFSDVLRALEREKLLRLETDEERQHAGEYPLKLRRRQMKRILIALISLLALLPAAALGQVVTMDEGHVAFDYPDSWLVVSPQLCGVYAPLLEAEGLDADELPPK